MSATIPVHGIRRIAWALALCTLPGTAIDLTLKRDDLAGYQATPVDLYFVDSAVEGEMDRLDSARPTGPRTWRLLLRGSVR